MDTQLYQPSNTTEGSDVAVMLSLGQARKLATHGAVFAMTLLTYRLWGNERRDLPFSASDGRFIGSAVPVDLPKAAVLPLMEDLEASSFMKASELDV